MSFSADEIGAEMSTNKNREAIVGFNKVDGGEPGFELTAIPTVRTICLQDSQENNPG
ncbi:hypothetical protein [Ensifer sp. 4252]|uniref:hypothetical protein n=1 Tax=Ensifer sp. 4252 TaxID=3373915 RepID=UPI003D1A3D4E